MRCTIDACNSLKISCSYSKSIMPYITVVPQTFANDQSTSVSWYRELHVFHTRHVGGGAPGGWSTSLSRLKRYSVSHCTIHLSTEWVQTWLPRIPLLILTKKITPHCALYLFNYFVDHLLDLADLILGPLHCSHSVRRAGVVFYRKKSPWS